MSNKNKFQELFNFMAQEYDVHLSETEMSEVFDICLKKEWVKVDINDLPYDLVLGACFDKESGQHGMIEYREICWDKKEGVYLVNGMSYLAPTHYMEINELEDEKSPLGALSKILDGVMKEREESGGGCVSQKDIDIRFIDEMLGHLKDKNIKGVETMLTHWRDELNGLKISIDDEGGMGI